MFYEKVWCDILKVKVLWERVLRNSTFRVPYFVCHLFPNPTFRIPLRIPYSVLFLEFQSPHSATSMNIFVFRIHLPPIVIPHSVPHSAWISFFSELEIIMWKHFQNTSILFRINSAFRVPHVYKKVSHSTSALRFSEKKFCNPFPRFFFLLIFTFPTNIVCFIKKQIPRLIECALWQDNVVRGQMHECYNINKLCNKLWTFRKFRNFRRKHQK